ncbi:ArnT family glycosyltransferase [Pseudohongiella nitratireducens]|uniref:ArnT family glycosyltransferase n=1 Tax=Pseudohongiella nitratireducens TaxID=1768907 RepID=UPI0030EF900F|tara:strand:+ start:18999 stop:20906 length:1908 start_codon:yes stop_codon:yes gene_type:complete
MQNPYSRQFQLQALCLVAFAVLITKLFLGWRLELYSDEIFYWQASRFPAIAYSDLPFMTAMLAGIGNDLFGNHPLAVRSLFLCLGSLLPLLVYWLARPLTGPRAIESALLSFCVPMVALMGLLAVPDVPMIVCGLLFVGFLERATRLNSNRYWLLSGFMVALGMCTHYRFIVYPASAFVYMALTKSQWHYWRRPVFWLAATIAVTGLIPTIVFNLSNDLSGVGYHLNERHPWAFQTDGLIQPLMQAAVVTPLMFIMAWLTMFWMYLQARQGDTRAGLMLAFAAGHILLFMTLAPWSDTTRTTVHWPLSGYLPILVYMPSAMRWLYTELTKRYSLSIANKTTASIPFTGLIGTALLLIGLGSQGFNASLQSIVGTDVLSNKMAGWLPLSDKIEQMKTRGVIDDDTLLVTDNYYTAAQIGFRQPENTVYTTDQDKTIRDGRDTQYRIWERDLSALAGLTDQNAVFITEDSTLDINEKTAVMQEACKLFADINYLDSLWLYQGDKRFTFYRANQIGGNNTDNLCPLPALVWLDNVDEGATLSGTYPISGWAVAPELGVERLLVQLNRRTAAEGTRNIEREDVVTAMNGQSDPEAPLLGFSIPLDTSVYSNGTYELSIIVERPTGEQELTSIRRITIRN